MVTIQSVNRALTILDLFSYARPSLSLGEISQDLGLAKGTTHNLVKTLELRGFLSQDPETRRYSLGSHLLALGTIMAGNLEVNRVAAGVVNQLADETGLISRVSVWDRDAVLVTLHAAPKYSESQAHRIGPRVEAYCSSLGRAILAFLEPDLLREYLDRVRMVALTPFTITDKEALRIELEATRKRGYALHEQEMVVGRASLAAPIRGRDGQVAASTSLTGNPDEILGDNHQSLAAKLLANADKISRRLGYIPGMADTARSRMENR